MLTNYKESITITAESAVTAIENGEERQVQAAYMSASIDEAGNVNIAKTVTNKGAYNNNKQSVRADFSEFESKVYAAEDGGTE